MGVDHIFHGIGDDVPGRQGVEHATMPHGDPIINSDGIEFLGNPTRLFDLARYQLPHILQMHVPWDELGEGIGNRDDGFGEIVVGHAGGAP